MCDSKKLKNVPNNLRGIGNGPLGSDNDFDTGNIVSGQDYDGDSPLVHGFKKAKKI